MKIVCRNRSDNAVAVVAVVTATVLAVVVFMAVDGLTWAARAWIAAWLVVCGAVFLARGLRWGITVDPTGVTIREVLLTRYLPWSRVRMVEIDDIDTCLIIPIGDHEPISVASVAAPGDPSLPRTCVELWNAARYPARGEEYPVRGGLVLVFAACAIAILVGPPFLFESLRDADWYDARAARDRHGIAVITDVTIEQHDDAEGNTSYTTVIDGLLQLDDGRLVDIRLRREGDRGSDYDEEAPLPVVYDSAHPHDADFPNRLGRIEDDRNNRLHQSIGVALLAVGVVGMTVVGRLMRQDWRSRFA